MDGLIGSLPRRTLIQTPASNTNGFGAGNAEHRHSVIGQSHQSNRSSIAAEDSDKNVLVWFPSLVYYLKLPSLPLNWINIRSSPLS